jgi:hypothetical protein
MNKAILAHLNNLCEKAEKLHTHKISTYKPLSPFATNKVKKIEEKVLGFKLNNLNESKYIDETLQ